jgi:diguanylate cyclase (GGDEF)-like protein
VDLTVVPDIFALTVFIVGFRPLVRRVGSYVNLWFLGWGLMLIHFCALLLVPSAGAAGLALQVFSFWMVDLCGAIFIMAAAGVSRFRIGRKVALQLALPVLVGSTLCKMSASTGRWQMLALVLYFVPGVTLLVSRVPRKRSLIVITSAFALFGLASIPLVQYDHALAAACGSALLFLSAAYLYFISAERYTRGSVAAILGLTTWGLMYPLVALLRQFSPATQIHHGLTELPQYLVLASIILTLLEGHVDRTERMAMHDPLTDLPNRRLFEERLVEAMDEATANRTTIACLVIDVDNFKNINDTLGHEAGDQLLRALSVRLSWHMSPRDILARTGGDEFTALLAGVRDEHHLRFIASAMMSAASVPIQLESGPVDVRISIGIALSPDHADDIDSLRRAADEAMYTAKRRGGSLLAFAGEE